MAEYYTQFSFSMTVTDKDQQDWLKNALTEEAPEGDEDADDDSVYPAAQVNVLGDTLYIFNDGDDGDASAVIGIVENFQNKFPSDSAEPVVVQWAEFSSKPVDDGFGGGVAVIYKGKTESMNTASWAAQKVQELTQ